MSMRKIRGMLLVLVCGASVAVGMLALSTPAEAGRPCIIRCAQGVCEVCCVQQGGWVCH